MTSPTNGFIQGDPVNGRWLLWKTSNGGLTWDSTGMYLQNNGGEFGLVNCTYVAAESGQPQSGLERIIIESITQPMKV